MMENPLDLREVPTCNALDLEEIRTLLSEPGNELSTEQARELWEQYMGDIEDAAIAPTLPSRVDFLETGMLSLND